MTDQSAFTTLLGPDHVFGEILADGVLGGRIRVPERFELLGYSDDVHLVDPHGLVVCGGALVGSNLHRSGASGDDVEGRLGGTG